jgi:hypothetical protein
MRVVLNILFFYRRVTLVYEYLLLLGLLLAQGYMGVE